MLPLLTIFLGAFLVFLVQPLIGNTLLPSFGGTAAVWSTCLAAFQLLLVGGYFYAHLVGGRARRVRFHLAALVLAVGWLVTIALRNRAVADWASAAIPVPAIGALVAVVVLMAIPYVILSANSSLVQLLTGGNYRLYAVSNLGSFLGLLAYPFVMERYFPISMQWRIFAALSALYVLFFAALMFVGKRRTQDERQETPSVPSTQHSALSTPHYFLLSFASCFLLNAVSTHLCTDITPLPMLWAGLLSAYLLSYVLAFTDTGSRYAPFAGVVVLPLSVYAAWHFGVLGSSAYVPELIIGFTILFFGGLIVHSRLYRIRPDASGLTGYYLTIALGGAVGGAVCSFLMPLVFNTVAEYPIALALVCGAVYLDVLDRLPASVVSRIDWRYAVGGFALFAVLGIYRGTNAEGVVLARYRNFYGLGSVAHKRMSLVTGGGYEANEFRSNGTIHGFQVVNGSWHGMEPTVYYAEHAGGLAIVKHPKFAAKKPMRVALCGMGIGTMSTYARNDDFYRFYEINPAVAAIAANTNLYTFVGKASGTVEVVVDDARRALERERAAAEPKYDVIIADVFNGDAIPPHMATREAFQLYLDRLAPDGILAFHLSNWHLNLVPMVKAAAKEFGLALESYNCRPSRYGYLSTWAFLARERLPELYDEEAHTRITPDMVDDVPLMSDDFHSILPYLINSKNRKY